MKKLIKFLFPLVCALVIVFSNASMVFASSRAVEPAPDGGGTSTDTTYDNIIDPFTDIITSSTVDNEKFLYIQTPAKGMNFNLVEHSISGGFSSTILKRSGYAFFTAQFGPRYLYNNDVQVGGYKYDLSVDFYSNSYYINCLRLDQTSNIEITYDLDLDYTDTINPNTGVYNYPTLKSAYIHYYNSNFIKIASYSTNALSSDAGSYSGTYKAVFNIDKPDNARYCSFTFNLANLEFFSAGFNDVIVNSTLKTKVSVIANRPTPVALFEVVDDTRYSDGHTFYTVENDDEIGSVRLTSSVSGYEQVYGKNFNSISFPGEVGDAGNYNINWRMFQPSRYLQIDPIVSGSYSIINFKFSVETDYDFFFPYIQVALYYYDSSFQQVYSQRSLIDRDYQFVDDNTGLVSTVLQLDIPQNAEYLAVSVIMQGFRLYGNSSVTPVTISLDYFEFGVEIENYTYYYGEFLINSANRLGSLGGQLGVSKPSLDSINTSIDSLVDRNTLLVYTGTLSQFWRSNTLTAIVLTVFTLTLISFIVFGKK